MFYYILPLRRVVGKSRKINRISSLGILYIFNHMWVVEWTCGSKENYFQIMNIRIPFLLVINLNLTSSHLFK